MEEKIDGAVEKKIDATQKLLRESEKMRSQTRGIKASFTIGIVVVVILYLWGMYASAKNRFAPAQVLQITQSQMQEMIPDIQKAAQEILQDVAPVYKEVFSKKMKNIQPKLKKQVSEELEAFNQYLRTGIAPKLVTGFDKIIEQQLAIVIKQLPGLNEENSAKIINNVMNASHNQINNLIAAKVLKEHVVTVDEIGQILNKFDVSDINLTGQALENAIEQTLLDLITQQLKEQVSAL